MLENEDFEEEKKEEEQQVEDNKETQNEEDKNTEQKQEKDNVEIDEDELFRRKLEEIRGKNENKAPFLKISSPIFFLMVLTLIFGIYYYTTKDFSKQTQEVTYTAFINKLKSGDILELTEKDDKLYGESKDQTIIYQTKKITNRIGDDSTIVDIINSNSDIKLKSISTSARNTIFSVILSIAPMIIILYFFMHISKKMMGGSGSGMNPFDIGKTKSKVKEKPKVTFDDVAGVDEAKDELKEVVEFLKDSSKFIKAGARIPKGVLLLGEPGTGKTLLAKAVAGESGASFFNISGSEFVELYVGVGASRVRDLFEEAKKAKPSIIFIDEIDAIGRKRSVGRNGGNDEREQTLNQLLVEMDGFETDAQIIVIAATNRDDILDSALLRSGRFDRRIAVSAPDLKGRIDILKVHARNKKLSQDVKLEDIAKITPGFVGADLENILNEAAILAARDSRDVIKMADLDEAVDKLGLGLGQKSKIITAEDKKMLAYHEGGHALVASLLPDTDKVHKVTIIPRGNAGGYTMTLPEETLNKRSKMILADIMVAFGGRVGEYLGMSDIGTGAYSDIQKATYYAKLYVQSYGLDSELGPINFEQSRQEEYAFVSSNSDETMRDIDRRVKALLKELYEKTVTLLREHKRDLDEVAALLLEKETVTGSEIRAIVSGHTHEEVLLMSEEEIEKYY